MNIWEKIDDINQKPEQIRILYVWGLTFFFMFVIVVIWVFSFREKMQSVGSDYKASINQATQNIQETKQQTKPSLDNIMKNYDAAMNAMQQNEAAQGGGVNGQSAPANVNQDQTNNLQK